MSFANRHNKGGIDWEIDTKDFPFATREACYKKDPEAVYTLRGIYINTKGKFGDHPVAITDTMFIDFPDYMTDEVKEILKTAEDIEDIKAGKVGFVIQEFTDKNFGKLCYGISWKDL